MTIDYNTIKLSKTEKRILIYVIQGYSNPKIGEKLGCSESCIKIHMSNILEKFSAKNRAQVAYIIGANNLTKSLRN